MPAGIGYDPNQEFRVPVTAPPGQLSLFDAPPPPKPKNEQALNTPGFVQQPGVRAPAPPPVTPPTVAPPPGQPPVQGPGIQPGPFAPPSTTRPEGLAPTAPGYGVFRPDGPEGGFGEGLAPPSTTRPEGLAPFDEGGFGRVDGPAPPGLGEIPQQDIAAMASRFQQMVATGQMTPQQAEQARAQLLGNTNITPDGPNPFDQTGGDIGQPVTQLPPGVEPPPMSPQQHYAQQQRIAQQATLDTEANIDRQQQRAQEQMLRQRAQEQVGERGVSGGLGRGPSQIQRPDPRMAQRQAMMQRRQQQRMLQQRRQQQAMAQRQAMLRQLQQRRRTQPTRRRQPAGLTRRPRFGGGQARTSGVSARPSVGRQQALRSSKLRRSGGRPTARPQSRQDNKAAARARAQARQRSSRVTRPGGKLRRSARR